MIKKITASITSSSDTDLAPENFNWNILSAGPKKAALAE